MTTIKLEMSKNDIIRAIKAFKHNQSPISYLAARYFREDIDNIDAKYDSILIWDDILNDYKQYKYCKEDINKVNNFLTEWQDFADEYTDEFTIGPIDFCVEELK